MKTTNQKDAFRSSDGDALVQRSRSLTDGLDQRLTGDPVVVAFQSLGASPQRLLEVGCDNGYRLEGLRRLLEAECHFLDHWALWTPVFVLLWLVVLAVGCVVVAEDLEGRPVARPP